MRSRGLGSATRGTELREEMIHGVRVVTAGLLFAEEIEGEGPPLCATRDPVFDRGGDPVCEAQQSTLRPCGTDEVQGRGGHDASVVSPASAVLARGDVGRSNSSARTETRRTSGPV